MPIARQEGGSGEPPAPARGCGGAGAVIPYRRLPPSDGGTEAAGTPPGDPGEGRLAWHWVLLRRGCSSRESRRGEEEGGCRRGLCRRSASAPSSRHTGMWQGDLLVETSRLSLPVPPLSRSSLPRQQHLLVLFQGSVQVAAVERRVEVRLTSASVPQILGRGHLQRGSCPLLCLQFLSGCLVSVNHPTKANTAGKD